MLFSHPVRAHRSPASSSPWLALPGAEARLRWWSALSGVDLVHLGTEADAEEIKDTAKTQPLLVAAALLTAEQLPMYDVTVTAGHSVGELAAAALAGVLSPEAAITLAGVRGREMAAACALEPTGMSAVLGGDARRRARRDRGRRSLPGQSQRGRARSWPPAALIGLEKLAASPPAKARVIALKVAGAFHTPYMAPAEQALAAVAGGIAAEPPTKILLSNLDGSAVDHGPTMLRRLVKQVTAPVRWDLCMATLADLGVTAVVELAPAGTLAGLAKRDLKGVEIVTVNTPDDLDAARDAIARHGAAPTHEPHPEFRVVVATGGRHVLPGRGPRGGRRGRQRPGARRGAHPAGPGRVIAHHAGLLTEWLANADDPVAPGQPLARIGGLL